MQQTKGNARARVPAEPQIISGQAGSPAPDTGSADNRARVVEALWRGPGLSRIDLAGVLGLDKSTLSRSTARLIDEGMIEELSTLNSGPKGGRPATGLAVRGDWGLWLGLELQPDGYFAVLVDLAGEIRASFSSRTPVNRNSIGSVIRASWNRAVRRGNELGVKLAGIGLSVPGPVRPGSGIVERSRPLNIQAPLNLARIAGKLTGSDVFVENDVNCCCRGETHFTTRPPTPNFLYLMAEARTKGLALGLGIMIDGNLYRGDHGASGEIMSIYGSAGSNQLSLSDDELTLAASDPAVLGNVVDELAPQAAFLANVLDIDRIILGGLFGTHYDALKPMFEEVLLARRTYPTLAGPEVLRACRGDEAPAYGAALYFTENLSMQPFWRTM